MAISGDYVLIGSEAGQIYGPPSRQVFLWNAATGELLHTFDGPSPRGAGSGFGEPG